MWNGLNNLLGKGSFLFPDIASQRSDEFAAQFMGHVGDIVSDLPKPSSYLRDVMRFVPDELANLLKLTTLRRAQGLDRLKALVGQQTRNMGLNPLSDAVDKVEDVF